MKNSANLSVRMVFTMVLALFLAIIVVCSYEIYKMREAVEVSSKRSFLFYQDLGRLSSAFDELGLAAGTAYALSQRAEIEDILEKQKILADNAAKILSNMKDDRLSEIISIHDSSEESSRTAQDDYRKILSLSSTIVESSLNVVTLRLQHILLGEKLRESRKSLSKSYRQLVYIPKIVSQDLLKEFNRSVLTVLSNDTAKDLAFIGRSVWGDVESNILKEIHGEALAEFNAFKPVYQTAWEQAVEYYAGSEDYNIFRKELFELTEAIKRVSVVADKALEISQGKVSFEMGRLGLLLGISVVAGFFSVFAASIKIGKKIDGSLMSLRSISASLLGLVSEIRNSSAKATHSAKEQSEASRKLQGNIREMDKAATQTVAASKETQSILNAIEKKTQQGSYIMDQMTSSMEIVVEATNGLKAIEKIISGIDQKLEVINKIVSKTQLLAVNASIEAAAAGNHGKGFAVVAQEMNNLASITGQAAVEIKDLLRHSEEQVASIIEKNEDATQKSLFINKEAVESFKEIASHVKKAATQSENMLEDLSHQMQGLKATTTATHELEGQIEINRAITQKNAELGELLNTNSAQLAEVGEMVSRVYMGQSRELTRKKWLKPGPSKLELILDGKVS